MKKLILVMTIMIYLNNIAATAQIVSNRFPVIHKLDSSEFRSKFALQSISKNYLDSLFAELSDTVGFIYIFRNFKLNGNLVISIGIKNNRFGDINLQLFKSDFSVLISKRVSFIGSIKRKLKNIENFEYEKGFFTALLTGSTCILLEQIFVVNKGNLDSGIFILDACGSISINHLQFQNSLWNIRKIIRLSLPKIERQLKRSERRKV